MWIFVLIWFVSTFVTAELSSLECGQTITGSTTEEGDINHYQFVLSGLLSDTYTLNFDSCGSSYDTYLYFYDENLNVITSCDGCGECDTQSQLAVSKVLPGSYIIGIGGSETEFGEYTIKASCRKENIIQPSGYVIVGNETYMPLDLCYYDRDDGIAYILTCYNQDLYMLVYAKPACDDPYYLDFNVSTSDPHNCDSEEQFTDYVEYTVYNSDIMGDIDCSSINSYDPPSNNASITNRCLYQPATKLYSMVTCTENLILTFQFSDSNCTNAVVRGQIVDECTHNETYFDIITCTTRMGLLSGSQYGYIQMGKDASLLPLIECTKSEDFSFLYACSNNIPYRYYWFGNSCGDLSTADGQQLIAPISFSCSSKSPQMARMTTYPNGDNCAEVKLTLQENYTLSEPYVVNRCFNYINGNNEVASAEWKCNNRSLWSINYDVPNCNTNSGNSWIGQNFTEICHFGDTQRYTIDCEPLRITSPPTQVPITTASPTKQPAASPVTPAPTNRFEKFQIYSLLICCYLFVHISNERIFYVTSNGTDNYECSRGRVPCGTLRKASYHASFAVGYDDIERVEIIVQGYTFKSDLSNTFIPTYSSK